MERSASGPAVLVIDDDVSRHPDTLAWCERIGLSPIVAAVPPDAHGGASVVVVHGGWGRRIPGFPRGARRAEAVLWLLGSQSYLFHEALDRFAALGRSLPASVPLIVITGGSPADLPQAELRAAAGAAGRRVEFLSFADLIGAQTLEGALSGRSDPARGTEMRHEILGRLWNLALAAGAGSPDPQEIREISEGEGEQSRIEDLIGAAPWIRESTRVALLDAISAAIGGNVTPGLALLARRALEEMEDARRGRRA